MALCRMISLTSEVYLYAQLVVSQLNVVYHVYDPTLHR
jgi:hypothetical protein